MKWTWGFLQTSWNQIRAEISEGGSRSPSIGRWNQRPSHFFYILQMDPVVSGSNKIKKKKRTAHRSTITSLVILSLTERSVDSESSRPDAAQWHSSPEDTHMGTQLCVCQIWDTLVTGVGDLPGGDARRAKTCLGWKVWGFVVVGARGGLICSFCLFSWLRHEQRPTPPRCLFTRMCVNGRLADTS